MTCPKSKKVQHTKEEARKIIQAMEQEGKKWGIYLCEHCSTWHVSRVRFIIDGVANI